MLFGGVLFPTSMLPGWIQNLAHLIPLNPALEGMRFALLQGYGLKQLQDVVLTLSLFSIVLLGAGILGFNTAVQMGRKSGSLTQY